MFFFFFSFRRRSVKLPIPSSHVTALRRGRSAAEEGGVEKPTATSLRDVRVSAGLGDFSRPSSVFDICFDFYFFFAETPVRNIFYVLAAASSIVYGVYGTI